MHPISIIIPCLNEEKFLPILLRSLEGIDCIGEVIVVDGGSKDRTREWVKEYSHQWTFPLILTQAPRANISLQRNIGADCARHDWLLFMDADTNVISPNDFCTFIDHAQQDRCDAAIPRYVGIDGGLRGRILFTLLHYFHRLMRNIMPYALGACILTTRSIFFQTGGFREDLTMNEDAHYVTAVHRKGLFGVYPNRVGVSARRFERYGYIKMSFWYIGIFFWRSVFGDSSYNPLRYACGGDK